MVYELWDRESRNLIDWYDDEAELRAALPLFTSLRGVAVAIRDERGRTEWTEPARWLP